MKSVGVRGVWVSSFTAIPDKKEDTNLNKARRKLISKVIEKLEDLKFELEEVKDEENETMENLPENLQYGERYEAMENAVNTIECAMDSIDESICGLSELVEGV